MACRSDCFSLFWIVITILPEQNPDNSESLTNSTFAQARAILRSSDAEPLPKSLNQESRAGNVPFDDLLQAFATVAGPLKHDVSSGDVQAILRETS